MSIKVNNKQIEFFNFSGGECHVSINGIDIRERTFITAHLYSSDDVMRLLLTVDAVRRLNQETNIHLTIPYFPYARQDRVCNKGEAFSLSVMAGLINNLNCKKVVIYDPHSQVTIDQVNNCEVISQAEILLDSLVSEDIKEKGLILVSPDKGAANKTKDAAEKLGVEAIYCTKVRDVKTGQITGTHIPEGVTGKNFIIIDDICDGGRTFTELSKALKKEGAKDLYLYVTHGIFSKGLDVLKEHFEHVYCHHCFLESDAIDQNFLSIIKEK